MSRSTIGAQPQVCSVSKFRRHLTIDFLRRTAWFSENRTAQNNVSGCLKYLSFCLTRGGRRRGGGLCPNAYVNTPYSM
ncbi:protein of unknown function [Paraburkholderia kururiensis]